MGHRYAQSPSPLRRAGSRLCARHEHSGRERGGHTALVRGPGWGNDDHEAAEVYIDAPDGQTCSRIGGGPLGVVEGITKACF